MQRLMLVFCSVGFCSVVAMGCAATGGGSQSKPTLSDDYNLTVFVNPANPTPSTMVYVIAQVQKAEDSSTLQGAVVQLTATLGEQQFGPLDFQEQESGNYRVDNVAFPAEGQWLVKVTVSANDLSMTGKVSVNVNCGGGGNVGDPCCTVEDCTTDLCVDSKCAVAAPTCSDQIANGNESDLDCGGTDCDPCPEGGKCGKNMDCVTGNCEDGLCKEVKAPLLNSGGQGGDGVTLTVIENKLLQDPIDLAFSPNAVNELWVVNKTGESFVIIKNPGQGNQTTTRYRDLSHHFMEKVVGLSFGNNSTMATCGETRNDYHGQGSANDFMGPVMWPGNEPELKKYGTPDASMAHLDMLHNTPNCMGISADTGNAFYLFNGVMNTVDWVDFKEPHSNGWDGHGGEDHKDGPKRRYMGLGIKRLANVPSALHYDQATGWLYVVDSGKSRIIRFKPALATLQNTKPTYINEQPIKIFTINAVEELVPKSMDVLFQPSGLVFHKKVAYVSDTLTSMILAFDEDWKLIEFADTDLNKGSLANITVGSDDRLYLVDRKSNSIVRLDP
jgi:hypothetical protein